MAEHLEEAQKDNSMSKLVRQHEQKYIMRLAKEFKEQYSSDNIATLNSLPGNHESREVRVRPPPVKRQDNQEIWWVKYVTTANKVKKNRPDITIWDTQKKICQIVEVSVPWT